MIASLSVLAVIPARGGSKGVTRKNIKLLAGRPMLAWTIQAALASQYLDRVVLSSEDQEIIDTARELGCEVPFRRPVELATDETPGIEPVLHALAQLPGHDLVVLLQPTSPLRRASDIDGCLEKLVATGAPACISVREATDHPYWCYQQGASERLLPFVNFPPNTFNRRQDLPRAFAVNGAVYVARVPWLLASHSFLTEETVGHEMPPECSLDLDTPEDFAIAESRLGAHSPRRG
jgi:CMP-N,N'-diacetyllegionaminic acid synthase